MDKRILIVVVFTLFVHNNDKLTVNGNLIKGFLNFFTKNSNEEKEEDGVMIYNRRKRITSDGGNKERSLQPQNFGGNNDVSKRNVDDEQLNDEILDYANLHTVYLDEEKSKRNNQQDSSSITSPANVYLDDEKSKRNNQQGNISPANVTLIEHSAKLKSVNDNGAEDFNEENTIRLGRSGTPKFEAVNSREEKEMSSIKTISSVRVPALRKYLDDDSGSGNDEDSALTEAYEWPRGRYGLPKSIYGCPKTFGVSWETGFRYHDTEDDGTENQRSDVFHLAANFSEDGISHEFCIKDDIDGEDDWPAGKYCIYKRGMICPINMKEGFVMWDDENTDNQNDKGGALPEGQYTEDTKIYFCCSTNGSVENQISLPARRPFFLFAYETARCQKVINMRVTSEFIKFDDEDHGNTDYEYGEYPYGIHKFQKDHMLFLCFYEPSKPVVSYYSEPAMTTNLEDENVEESLRQGEEIMKAFMKETGGVEDSDNKKERGKTIIKTIKVPVQIRGSPVAIVLGLVLGSIVIGTAIIFMAKLVIYNSYPPAHHPLKGIITDKVETIKKTTEVDPPVIKTTATVIDNPKECGHESDNSSDSCEEVTDTWSDLDEDNELVEDQLLPDSELKSGLELLFLKQQRHYWNQRRQHQRREDS